MFNMTTDVACTGPVTPFPIKFMGATVLSMSARMGWGVQSSSLNIQLVEDCIPTSGYNTFTEAIENYGPDNFIGNDIEIIGSAAYFSLPAPDSEALINGQNERNILDKFRFGGIVNSWSTSLGSNGLIYNVDLVDPREILYNTMIVLDSYSDLPFQHINYYNVYAAYEAGVNYGICNVFGSANSTQRGMNYRNALKGLVALAGAAGDTVNYRLNVYSPTTDKVGYAGLFKLDLGYILPNNDIYEDELQISRNNGTQLPLGPENFRITNNISVLEFIQNICNVTGTSFYTNLKWDFVRSENVIEVSVVDFEQQSTGNEIISIVPKYKGYSTNLTYGRELRNEPSRKIIFGDQVHYLANTTNFLPFFGVDSFGNPIYPLTVNGLFVEPDGETPSSCGFWIFVDIFKLNAQLRFPITDSQGQIINSVWISENDIRAALGSYDLWQIRTFSKDERLDYTSVQDSLVKILQESPVYKKYNTTTFVSRIIEVLSGDNFINTNNTPYSDILTATDRNLVEADRHYILKDIETIHKFIQNLGSTYYGKQFLTQLNENICVTVDNEEGDGNGFGEKIYSSIPTNDGGWVDYNIPVLGLTEPALSFFRSDDSRIKPFSIFSNKTSETGASDNTGLPDNNPPDDPPDDPEPPDGE